MSTLIQRALSRGPFVAPDRSLLDASRMKALATVRWVRRPQTIVSWRSTNARKSHWCYDPAQAMVYDGRDNEALKARFFAALFKVPLTVVLLDQ